MTLQSSTIDSHIARWERALSFGAYGYRSNWPSRLFRHEPIENAVSILKHGTLLSRAEAAAQNLIVTDIAPSDIINHNARAHDYARLYFRPRNPTQYHIEGIKKADEIYKGKHAPVIVVFIFKSSEILCRNRVSFSDGNMQSETTTIFSEESAFKRLPFSDIYHEGPFSPESRENIIRRRCAEVLIPKNYL